MTAVAPAVQAAIDAELDRQPPWRDAQLTKAMQSPGAGWSPIPAGKNGGYRKRKASGRGWDYWYPDQHVAGGDWEVVPGVTGTATMKPGQYAFVLGLGSKLVQWVPDHEGDLPEGQTWVLDLETDEPRAVLSARVQPARARTAKPRPATKPKPKATKPTPATPTRQPAKQPVQQATRTDEPNSAAVRVPVYAGSTAKPGTVLHDVEHGAFGVLRYQDGNGRTQVGMYVPKPRQAAFLDEMRGLIHAAVSHVARTHRIRTRGGSGATPEYQDLFSAAQLGLVQATRAYKGQISFAAHAYRYMKTYAAIEARQSYSRGAPLTARVRRLTEGYLAACARATAREAVESPTDAQVARHWRVSKSQAANGQDLGRYVTSDKEGNPIVADQGREPLPLEDWRLRGPDGVETGPVRPGKLTIVAELRQLTSGERVDLADIEAAGATLPKHAAATMPAGTAHHLRQQLDSVLAGMDPELARVLSLRWGLDGSDPLSYADIGAQLGLGGDTKRAQINAADRLVTRATESFRTIAEARSSEVQRYAQRWSAGPASEGVVVAPAAAGAQTYRELAATFTGSDDPPEVVDERVQVYTAMLTAGAGTQAAAILKREAAGTATPSEIDGLRAAYSEVRDQRRLADYRRQTATMPVDAAAVREAPQGDPGSAALYTDEVLQGYMAAVARRGLPGFVADPSPGGQGQSKVWTADRLARFLGTTVERIED